MFQSKSFRLLVIFCTMFLMVVGCKTDPKNSTNETVENQIYTVTSILSSEPDMLNPCISTKSVSRQVFNHIFSHLIHYDTKTLKAAPMLAKSLPTGKEITEGEFKGLLSYDYEIHDEAIWDDGTPVTGHDVAFTVKAFLNPKVPAGNYRGVAAMIKDINIDETNPKKFSVVKDNYFLSDYIFTDIPTIPAAIYDPKGLLKDFSIPQLNDKEAATELAKTNPKLQEFATDFISEKYSREKEFVSGSGPYKLEEWQTGQRIILKRKENWWGTKLAKKFTLLQAKPESIVYRIILDPVASATELKAGGADVMGVVTSEEFVNLKNSTEGQANLNFYEPLALTIYYIGMNRNRPALADKKVRRALAHLVDVDQIIKDVMLGYAKRVNGIIHPSRPYHLDLPLIDFNIEKAQALLKEAGWEDSNNNGIVDKVIDGERTELKLEYLTSTSSTVGKAIAELIKPLAKRAGVEIDVVIKDIKTVSKRTSTRDYDLVTGGSAFDPSIDDLYQRWHTDNDAPTSGNRFSFGDEISDKIIEEIRTRIDDGRRKELYKKFQEILYEDQPCIFLLAPSGRVVVSKRFDYEPSVRKPGVFENEFMLRDASLSEN